MKWWVNSFGPSHGSWPTSFKPIREQNLAWLWMTCIWPINQFWKAFDGHNNRSGGHEENPIWWVRRQCVVSQFMGEISHLFSFKVPQWTQKYFVWKMVPSSHRPLTKNVRFGKKKPLGPWKIKKMSQKKYGKNSRKTNLKSKMLWYKKLALDARSNKNGTCFKLPLNEWLEMQFSFLISAKTQNSRTDFKKAATISDAFHIFLSLALKSHKINRDP